MSYQEKSAWVCLAATLVVFVPYFTYIFMLPVATLTGATLAAGIAAVVAMIVITAVGHAVIALQTEDKRDERDVLIETKSYRNAYWVLATGVMVVAAALYLRAFNPALAANTPLLMLAANAILLCFVLAEVTSRIRQIVLYRKAI